MINSIDKRTPTARAQRAISQGGGWKGRCENDWLLVEEQAANIAEIDGSNMHACVDDMMSVSKKDCCESKS